jgi:ubiquitin carboxyl-terminal hydrolase 5/13
LQVVAWQDVREVSRYGADLVQVNNGVKVPPSGNKCSRCDLTENLWMNLTDGTILCGRKNFDGVCAGRGGATISYAVE